MFAYCHTWCDSDSVCCFFSPRLWKMKKSASVRVILLYFSEVFWQIIRISSFAPLPLLYILQCMLSASTFVEQSQTFDSLCHHVFLSSSAGAGYWEVKQKSKTRKHASTSVTPPICPRCGLSRKWGEGNITVPKVYRFHSFYVFCSVFFIFQ